MSFCFFIGQIANQGRVLPGPPVSYIENMWFYIFKYVIMFIYNLQSIIVLERYDMTKIMIV